MTEVQAEAPGQLSLVQEQPVTIVDSKREDWWLVRTIPDEDTSPPVEGWVHTSKLRPDDSEWVWSDWYPLVIYYGMHNVAVCILALIYHLWWHQLCTLVGTKM